MTVICRNGQAVLPFAGSGCAAAWARPWIRSTNPLQQQAQPAASHASTGGGGQAMAMARQAAPRLAAPIPRFSQPTFPPPAQVGPWASILWQAQPAMDALEPSSEMTMMQCREQRLLTPPATPASRRSLRASSRPGARHAARLLDRLPAPELQQLLISHPSVLGTFFVQVDTTQGEESSLGGYGGGSAPEPPPPTQPSQGAARLLEELTRLACPTAGQEASLAQSLEPIR